MSEITAPPQLVRQLHVEIVSNGGVTWTDVLKLDEGDSYTESPDGWEFFFVEKEGTRVVVVERMHTFFSSLRTEIVEIKPLYVPTEHRDKEKPVPKRGRIPIH